MRISDWSSDVCSSDLTDDIQAHQQQAALVQTRANSLGYFKVVRCKCLSHSSAARRQITARFACQRDARQAIRHRLAGDQQNAFVALDDFRNIALRHEGARSVRSEEHTFELQLLMRNAYAV